MLMFLNEYHVCFHCRTLLHDCQIVWLDNFSNLFRQVMPDAFNGFYHECLWSVCAGMKVKGMDSSSLATLSRNGAVVPALPHNMMSVEQVKVFIQLFESVNNEFGTELFESSLCVKLGVNTIPLKPTVNPDNFPSLKAALLSRDETLASISPFGLFPLNPAANEGLYRLFGLFIGKDGLAHPERYFPVLCDVNLFNRILKVRDIVFSVLLIITSNPHAIPSCVRFEYVF